MLFRVCCLRFSPALACTLLLGACAGMPVAQPDNRRAAEQARNLHEKEMQMTWVNQPYEDLIKVFGPPNLIMNIPAFRPWKASVVVYEGSGKASGCIDAFAVEHASKPVIYDYFCR